jgi:hypothetical protein
MHEATLQAHPCMKWSGLQEHTHACMKSLASAHPIMQRIVGTHARMLLLAGVAGAHPMYDAACRGLQPKTLEALPLHRHTSHLEIQAAGTNLLDHYSLEETAKIMC